MCKKFGLFLEKEGSAVVQNVNKQKIGKQEKVTICEKSIL